MNDLTKNAIQIAPDFNNGEEQNNYTVNDLMQIVIHQQMEISIHINTIGVDIAGINVTPLDFNSLKELNILTLIHILKEYNESLLSDVIKIRDIIAS